MNTEKGFFDIDDEWFDVRDDWNVVYESQEQTIQPNKTISKTLTTDEILDGINIIDIERYLRKKKIERINEVRKTLNK